MIMLISSRSPTIIAALAELSVAVGIIGEMGLMR
jgi:hypothetical protein